MHDIDRTQLESAGFESDFHESGEMAPEFFEVAESPLSEEQELELASELLEVASDQHLEQFLGDLIGKVGSAVGQFARSDTGRALGGILKDAARQALPVVGRAVGQWVSPGRGGAIGADLATQAGRIMGLELEGLSSEDKEFEVARQFVRFASAAAKHACIAPPAANPLSAARAAALAAGRVSGVSVKDLGLSLDCEGTPEVRLAQVCAKCGQEINAERRRGVLALLKLFGIGHGWRRCDCRQSLLKGWGPNKQIFDPLKQDWPPWK